MIEPPLKQPTSSTPGIPGTPGEAPAAERLMNEREETNACSASAPENVFDLPMSMRPRHIAIIMDGNGRWAQKQGKPRIFGHQAGAKVVRDIVTECAKLKLEALTLYSFSTDNWKRPADEVHCLMELYAQYLASEREIMMENNVRFIQIGRRKGLPEPVLVQLDQTTAITQHNTGLTLALAINYGSRAEITDAMRAIAQKVTQGKLQPDQIQEQTISDHLYTANLPDPDLLIRTAGEMRLSNYLLWQISYAELYVEQVCWPQFTISHLHNAICEYAGRKRKYGGIETTTPCA